MLFCDKTTESCMNTIHSSNLIFIGAGLNVVERLDSFAPQTRQMIRYDWDQIKIHRSVFIITHYE